MTSRRLILVAEDHDDQRELLVLACKREGFDVLEASNGHDLVALVRAQHARGELGDVVLVISDVMMPGMTGFDASEALTREGFDVPFLFQSALDDPETRARALGLRAIAIFAKPFELNALRRFLREHNVARGG